jgi:hypothetical protein
MLVVLCVCASESRGARRVRWARINQSREVERVWEGGGRGGPVDNAVHGFVAVECEHVRLCAWTARTRRYSPASLSCVVHPPTHRLTALQLATQARTHTCTHAKHARTQSTHATPARTHARTRVVDWLPIGAQAGPPRVVPKAAPLRLLLVASHLGNFSALVGGRLEGAQHSSAARPCADHQHAGSCGRGGRGAISSGSGRGGGGHLGARELARPPAN